MTYNIRGMVQRIITVAVAISAGLVFSYTLYLDKLFIAEIVFKGIVCLISVFFLMGNKRQYLLNQTLKAVKRQRVEV